MKISSALCAAILSCALIPTPALAVTATPPAETVTPLDQRGPDLDDMSTDPAYQQFFTQEVKWGAVPCPTDRPTYAKLDCAQIRTPKDWHDVGQGTLLVGISRPKTAASPRPPRLLLSNPGGPGNSGLTTSYLRVQDAGLAATHLPVGIDPRGVGLSSQLHCRRSFDLPATAANPKDARKWTAEDITATKTRMVHDELACRNDPTNLHRFVNTENTARDFDLVRHLMGYASADFYGMSYGTMLGSVLGKMFPHRVDRLVFDGNTKWHVDAQGRGFFTNMAHHQEALDTVFLPWLARHHATYHLGATPAEVNATIERLVDAAVEGKLGEGYTGTEVLGLLTRAVRIPGGYLMPEVARTLQTWNEGLDSGAAMPANPHPDPTGYVDYVPSAVNAAIHCNDGGSLSMNDFVTRFIKARTTYPILAQDALTFCVDWPHPPALSDAIIHRPLWGALMMQNEDDPATPYEDALGALRATTGQVRMVLGDDVHGHCLYEGATPGATALYSSFLTSGSFPTVQLLQGAPLPDENVIYEYGNPATSDTPHPEPVPYPVRRFEQPPVDQAATAAWQQVHPGGVHTRSEGRESFIDVTYGWHPHKR